MAHPGRAPARAARRNKGEAFRMAHPGRAPARAARRNKGEARPHETGAARTRTRPGPKTRH